MNQHSNTPRVCVCGFARTPLAGRLRELRDIPLACLRVWQVLGTTIYFILAQKSKVKKQVVELIKKVLSKFDRASAEAAPTLRADTYEARMLLCVWLIKGTHTHA